MKGTKGVSLVVVLLGSLVALTWQVRCEETECEEINRRTRSKIEQLAEDLGDLRIKATQILDDERAGWGKEVLSTLTPHTEKSIHLTSSPKDGIPEPDGTSNSIKRRVYLEEELVLPSDTYRQILHRPPMHEEHQRKHHVDGMMHSIKEKGQQAAERVKDAVKGVVEKGEEVTDKVKGAVEGVVEKGGQLLQKAEEKGDALAERAKEKFHKAGSAVKEKVVDAVTGGKELLQTVSEKGREVAQACKEKGQTLLHETEEGVQALKDSMPTGGTLKEGAEGWNRGIRSFFRSVGEALFGHPAHPHPLPSKAAPIPPREVGQKFVAHPSIPTAIREHFPPSEHERIELHTTIDVTTQSAHIH